MLVLSSLCRLMILGVIMISNSVRWLESPLTPKRKPNPGMLCSNGIPELLSLDTSRMRPANTTEVPLGRLASLVTCLC